MLGQFTERTIRWRVTVRWTSPTSSLAFNASGNDMKAAVLIITLAFATILIASAVWLYTPDKSRSLLEAAGNCLRSASGRYRRGGTGTRRAPLIEQGEST